MQSPSFHQTLLLELLPAVLSFSLHQSSSKFQPEFGRAVSLVTCQREMRPVRFDRNHEESESENSGDDSTSRYALEKKYTAGNEDVPNKESSVVMGSVKLEPPDSDSGGIMSSNKRLHLEIPSAPKPSRTILARESVEVEAPDSDFDFDGLFEYRSKKSRKSTAFPSKRIGSKVQNARPRRNHGAGSNEIETDASYQAFLYSSETDGYRMIYMGRNGRQHVYEKDGNTSSGQKSKRRMMREKTPFLRSKEDVHFSDRGRLCEDKCDLVDESYEEFLKYIEVCGKNVIYKPIDGEPKIYDAVEYSSDTEMDTEVDMDPSDIYHSSTENTSMHGVGKIHEDVDSSSDSKADMDPADVYHSPTENALADGGRKIHEDVEYSPDSKTDTDPSYTYPTLDLDEGQCITSPNQFREGLMKDLERPYNPDEHIKLLMEASKHRPIDHDSDLHHGMKSYLEVYKDLGKEMNTVHEDDTKTLNLLRALFYWLQNVSQEGSFIPWKDKIFMKVFQQPREKQDGSRLHSMKHRGRRHFY